MRSGWFHRSAVFGLAAALGACGGDGGTDSNTLTVELASPSGNAQTDTIGAPLDQPLRVLVTRGGAPASGKSVAWAVTAGGGQVTAATSETGSDGVATMDWRLGTTAGAQTATATVTSATGSPVAFDATATPGRPTNIDVSSGDGQIGFVNLIFPAPLTVRVIDRAGNPVPGATVNWAVLAGSLVLDAPSSQTSAQGIATIAVQAGPTPGPASLGAQVAGAPTVSTFFDMTIVNADRTVNIGPAVAFTSVNNGSSNPAVDTLPAGQTMVWVNNGGSHTVRPIPINAFPASGDIPVGSYHIVTFNTPGTYQYNCQVHGNAMTGTIVVQ